MKISPSQARKQYEYAKSQGWMPLFEQMADEHNTTVAHFLGIGSRETNLKNIRGDFRGGKHHGYGVLQVDIGTDATFAEQWTAANAEPGIRRGFEIYDSKVVQIENGQGKNLTVKGKRFKGKKVEPDDLRRIATAAYNCGLWAYYHFSKGNHIDSSTTGKDYSRDVYDRAVEFAALREQDGDLGALSIEVVLQGKYARAVHQKRARVIETPDLAEPVIDLAVEPEGPEPPEPSVTTVPGKPPVIEVQPRSTSILTKIGTAVAGLGPIATATGLKIGNVEFNTVGIVAISAVIIVGMLTAAYLWNRSQERRSAELRASMSNLASPEKLNVVAGSGQP